MEELNRYIEFRYPNWLDYATQMAKQHRFIGWEKDLLNESVIQLLKKDPDKLKGLLARKTKKIVNGKPTTELDKFILTIMNTNAFSPVAPFRKNVLGNKILSRQPKKVETCIRTELNGHDQIEQSSYEPEFKGKLDLMHSRNIKRLCDNGFNSNAVKLYQTHFIRGRPLKEYTDTNQDYISEINQFLVETKKTLLDND